MVVECRRAPGTHLQRRASTGGATPSRLAAAMECGEFLNFGSSKVLKCGFRLYRTAPPMPAASPHGTALAVPGGASVCLPKASLPRATLGLAPAQAFATANRRVGRAVPVTPLRGVTGEPHTGSVPPTPPMPAAYPHGTALAVPGGASVCLPRASLLRATLGLAPAQAFATANRRVGRAVPVTPLRGVTGEPHTGMYRQPRLYLLPISTVQRLPFWEGQASACPGRSNVAV